MKMNDEFDGFLDLNNCLEDYIKLSDPQSMLDEEEKIAQNFVNDLKKLPRPRSKISKAGYTHLIDTFTYRRTKDDIAVGWGKYYGRMVEDGSVQMKKGGTPHLVPTWNRNSDKYISDFKKRNNLI